MGQCIQSKSEPKLKQKRYRWLDKNANWKNIILPKDTYWAGASAAETLTNYLIPGKLTIYTGFPFHEVMKTLKMVPDEKGGIQAYEKFWANSKGSANTVHPILIYADLINDPNPRCLETADKI